MKIIMQYELERAKENSRFMLTTSEIIYMNIIGTKIYDKVTDTGPPSRDLILHEELKLDEDETRIRQARLTKLNESDNIDDS